MRHGLFHKPVIGERLGFQPLAAVNTSQEMPVPLLEQGKQPDC
jgi:hypothetical protein